MILLAIGAKMNKKSIRMITVSGSDGCGKSTQLNILKMTLEAKGAITHNTRLLGGDKTDDFQLALRTVLLHDKFPSNSVELEEQLFAMTDLEGIKIARKFLENTPNGIVLKDRGACDHLVYALAKGMTLDALEKCHADVIKAEEIINQDFGALNLILVPDNVSWPLERIKKRALTTGEPIVERLENLENQERVIAFLQQVQNYDILRNLNFEVIILSEDDSILDVKAKVEEVLKKYDIVTAGPVAKEA